jgi:4-hydroxybenzoate polyprenyltransferase
LILKHLKIARPGLWFPTIWIYLVPFTFSTAFWESTHFWVGFVFVTFPLNYLVYGLNDYNDVAADTLNDRKGNFLFGAKASVATLSKVPMWIALVNLPFVIYFVYVSGWQMFLLLSFMVLVNIIYNFKPCRIKERPPFEILIQVGYVMTALFSLLLNTRPMLPWLTMVYLCLFAFQAHIAGEIMDIEPDRKAGKKTTATFIGRRNAKGLMLGLLLLEVLILSIGFQDYVLSSFLLVFSAWLVLDIFIFFKDTPYTVAQMKLFGWAMNLSAVLSMIWVLYSGKLLTPVI